MLRSIGFFLAAGMLVFATSSSAAIQYMFDVTTNYAFGPLPAGTLGPAASPDTGFFTITNAGTSVFTGIVSDVAVSNFAGDLSQSFSGVTLNPGDSISISIASDSSNNGGYNGPFGSTQPGVIIEMSGLINGTQPFMASVNDSQIHSGVPRTNPFGITLDNYVLQGGDPLGQDPGDAYETTQAPGHFVFSNVVPEPGYYGVIAFTLPVLFLLGRRLRVSK